MRYIRRLIIVSYQNILEGFIGIFHINLLNVGIDDSNIHTVHPFTSTNETIWSFVKLWTGFLTHKQLRHLHTSIKIVWQCVYCQRFMVYYLNGFTHRKIFDFSFFISSNNMKPKTKKLWVILEGWSGWSLLQRFLENIFLKIG